MVALVPLEHQSDLLMFLVADSVTEVINQVEDTQLASTNNCNAQPKIPMHVMGGTTTTMI